MLPKELVIIISSAKFKKYFSEYNSELRNTEVAYF